MDEMIYKIAIAAFLHDIGKFAERAGFMIDPAFAAENQARYQRRTHYGYSHVHALYTAAFIDHAEKLLPAEFNREHWGADDSFMDLAAGHHNPQTPLQWIIAMADRVSSGLDRAEYESDDYHVPVRDFRKTRMTPLFAGITLPDKQASPEKFIYPLCELSPRAIFPEPATTAPTDDASAKRHYHELLAGFLSALEKLAHKTHVPLWFEHFDSLFLLYASAIPAATVGKVIPDVSLYDHSRAAAALAAALYRYHRENDSLVTGEVTKTGDRKLLLVSGDFNGIQRFIFAAGHTTNRYLAKLLRGRSFAVAVLAELAADLLCRKLGLPPTSVALNAAGKFTIIAANTAAAREAIAAADSIINDWLVRHYLGEVSFSIAVTEASCDEFHSKTFNKLWQKHERAAADQKFSRLDLDRHGGVVVDYLERFDNSLTKSLCPFCGKRPASAAVEGDPLLGDVKSACTLCRDHIYLGAKLPKTTRLAITTADADLFGDKLAEPIFGEYQLSLDVAGRLQQLAGQGTLLKYWDLSPAQETLAKDISRKFINGYIPMSSEEDRHDATVELLLHSRKSSVLKDELFDGMMQEGTPKTFHFLAIKALNCLEGETICGLEALGILKADVDNLGLIFAGGIKNPSLSRVATMSRQLNQFFSMYVPYKLAAEPDFHNIYTVFAGGDDLFLIGPWNRIIDFAGSMHEWFEQYVCHNPSITISAGISLHHPSEPVTALAEQAEHALSKSKDSGRNSVTIFDEVVGWQDHAKLLEIKTTMERWLKDGYINNAMLYRLHTFIDLVKQERALQLAQSFPMAAMECLKWRSQLKYQIARNVGKGLAPEQRTAAIREVEQLAEWLLKYGSAVKIPVWRIIYDAR